MINRRRFIGTILAGAGAAATGVILRGDERRENERTESFDRALEIDRAIKKPTDQVALGKSGIKVSLVGIGTGSGGWAGASNQTRLGQKEFTHQMRHAFESGINFYDLADQYGSHPYFERAMAGVPRADYVVQTKTTSREPAAARADIDRFLKELKTDYIDSLIIHNVTDANWTRDLRGVMDVFEEAKKSGKIRAHGVTCHSFVALEAAEASPWVDLNMVRWNSRQSHMDADVETAGALFAKMRGKGQGMIGMKVVGQGALVEGAQALTPEECFRFQIESGVVDAFVIGVQSVKHIDQLLSGTQAALDQVGYRVVTA